MKEKELKSIYIFWIKPIISVENKPSILPLGGMEFKWENYLTLTSGTLMVNQRILYNGVNINLDNLKKVRSKHSYLNLKIRREDQICGQQGNKKV